MKKIQSMEEFSPEAKTAIESRKVEGSWEYRKLVKLLAELTQFDVVNEKATQRAKWTMIGCIVAGVVSMLIGMVLETGWAAFSFLGAVGAGIFFGKRYFALKKRDLIDDFRSCLIPALSDLQHDLSPEKKIRVRMQLSGPDDSKAGKSKHVPSTSRYDVTDTPYPDPWCEVRLPLVDGSTAVLDFHTEWVKRVKKSRFRRRNGYKTKTSWRKLCSVTASLIPDRDKEWNEPLLQQRVDSNRETAEVIERDGLRVGRIERRWKFKGQANILKPPKSAPAPREVVGMLLRLHAVMGLSTEAKS